jgi:hypothetical protein
MRRSLNKKSFQKKHYNQHMAEGEILMEVIAIVIMIMGMKIKITTIIFQVKMRARKIVTN